jgi:hypothetical protein
VAVLQVPQRGDHWCAIVRARSDIADLAERFLAGATDLNEWALYLSADAVAEWYGAVIRDPHEMVRIACAVEPRCAIYTRSGTRFAACAC